MTVFEKLQPASFDGFPFLVRAESSPGGKKFVSHEYPGSNKRFVETFGKIPPIFNLDAIVHGDINLRLQFEDLLREEGIKTLVHPIYGSVEVESTTFSVSSNDTKVGEFAFSINFESTEPNVTADPRTVDEFQVTSDLERFLDSIDNALEFDWEPPSFAESFQDAADRVDGVFQSIQNTIGKITNPIQENVAAFTNILDSARDGVFTIVSNASTLKETFKDVYRSFSNIASAPADLADAWDDLSNFRFLPSFLSGDTFSTNPDDEEVELKTDTTKRQEVSDNTNILSDHTQLTALAGMYEAAAYTDFKTETELTQKRDEISDKYNEFILSDIDFDSTIKTLALDPTTRANMNTLKNDADNVFDQKEQAVPKIIIISPGRSSMFLTTYRYYGNIDNVDLLIDLNNDVNSAKFNEDIKAIK